MRSSVLKRNASSGLVILAEFRNFLQYFQANVLIVLADRLRPFPPAPLASPEQRMWWNEIQLFGQLAEFHAFSGRPEIVLFILRSQ